MNNFARNAAIAIAVIAVAGLGTSIAFAHGAGDGSSFAEKFAERFDLDQADVQTFVDEMRAEHHSRHEAMAEERLNQLIEDGELTDEQAQLLLNKRAELKAEMEANRELLKDATPDERHELMQEKIDELRDWADANDIDFKYLRMGHHGRHFGPRM